MRPIDQRADAVRAFNRFYTRRIGALDDAHLGTEFTLGEMRVLYELAHRAAPTATEIGDALGLDRGYLSRTLRSFMKRGLIATERGPDRRTTLLHLSAAGRKAFAPLERKARDAVVAMLEPLPASEQQRVVASMNAIRAALGDPADRVVGSPSPEPFTIRAPRAGDLGWIVHRHGVLYAEEFGYDDRFEALVAKVVAEFVEHRDDARDRCWIAERDGAVVGSIFLVGAGKRVAKLRLLLVEPAARGLGVGTRLVDEVICAARQIGYTRLELWTQSELTAARRIYVAAGFTRVAEERHARFGKPLTAETWALEL